MEIELLVVPDCPSAGPAAAAVHTALRDVGLSGIDVTTTVIASPQEAELRGFAGSPTILLNGHDPFAEPRQRPALACRRYPYPSGPSGVPELAALRRALKQAADAAG